MAPVKKTYSVIYIYIYTHTYIYIYIYITCHIQEHAVFPAGHGQHFGDP